MGLPEINITFSGLAVSAIQRSQRGIVALILKDDTDTTFERKEYTSVTEIDPLDWTATNKAYIEQAFLGVPSKVIVERLAVAALNYNEALTRLSFKKWNYLAVPGIAGADTTAVATQIKTWRDTDKRTYKAVLPNIVADHEGIINFTTEGIVVNGTTYSASQYTARIAGILAGLPFTRSATYYVLPEVEAITEHTTPDADIDAGELILINDGEKIKIGRGVNSLTTTTTSKGQDFKKIKIIEGHDLVKEDITRTFNDEYVGKVNNSYDNQALFITAVNAYLRGLQPDVLDPAADNLVGVDVEAQRLAWEGVGTDTSSWDDQKVKNTSFQSKVFLSGNLKFLDAIEDLALKISV
ncbi:phage tail sheath C-terminal domain-containing protein [Paenibacillus validus]|uniref:phage tail sheath C-terminal domain-containing protein n=1 Tax=Paenibacillus validus TaxID=44253 RepID=UPI000FDAA5C2|nr:phage tail sheath C-terminal domain-containing protein [Paenibacillus validus]MED4599871.1 phage tail sheath C-terminal domain-containing protein [Paenibacillus validus]MED4606096.1 phage tail sheath C-terminal domain-containing protein [Paenibacillus validus]